MALPASGTLSLSAIGTEFGDTAPNSISEFYRGGSLVKGSLTFNQNVPTSGVIAFSNFYSAAKVFQYDVTVGTYTSLWDLRAQSVTAGWNASDRLLVVLSGATTFNAGITVSGSFPNGVGLEIGASSVVNGSTGAQGTEGARGLGGSGGTVAPTTGFPGSAGGLAGNGATGGTAITTSVSLTVNNFGTINGGTGGAAGVRSGGGGGGGGAGVTTTKAGDTYFAGGSGGNGYSLSTGGPTAGGAGGTNAGTGGSGGASGAAGAAGAAGNATAGGAGGAAGGAGSAGGQGNYISGNAFVTWINTGTRTGGVA